MTEKARELGMTNSNFLNSHGLHEEGHHSSARDLAILAERIINDFPEYYDYYSRRSFAYGEDLKSGKPIEQFNRNPILGVVAGADGLKTGFTDAGGYGLTASAKRGDTRLIMVINGEPTHRARAREAERILNWGFRNFGTYTLLTEGQLIDETPVWLGEKAKVPLVAAKQVRLTLSREARRKVKGEAIYNTPVPAAIEKGAPLGRIVLTIPDMDPIEVPLVAGDDVPKVGGLSKIGSAFDYLVFGSSGEE
jgi:D-alanyl-D-alanine carboxypeptidase (penicillin-binding protein 5/6)